MRAYSVLYLGRYARGPISWCDMLESLVSPSVSQILTPSCRLAIFMDVVILSSSVYYVDLLLQCQQILSKKLSFKEEIGIS